MANTSSATFAQVIKEGGFRSLWINQVLLQIAYNALNFSLLIWVFSLTNSNLAVAMLMLSILLPAILFGIFSGVLVDISDRRKVILLVDAGLVVVFLLFLISKDTYAILLTLSFILNSIYQFFIPAEGSSIPLLVKKEHLLLANSLFQTTLFGALLIGYSLAGPVINFFSINTVFIIGAALSFLGFLVSQKLPPIVSSNGAEEKKLAQALIPLSFKRSWQLTKKQILQTVNFIRGKLAIAVAIGVLAGVQGVVGTLAVLVPAYMERVMHIPATDASYIMMLPLGLGMVIGAFLVGKFGQGLPKRALVTRGIIYAGLVLVLIGMAPIIGREYQTLDLGEKILRKRPFFHAPSLSTFLAFFAFLLGVFTVIVIIPAQTVLQESTPARLRGKIFAVLAVFMAGFASLPVIIAGGLADFFGVIPVMVGLGLVIILIGLLGYKPASFLAEGHLPYKLREFLGLGHWE